MKPSAGPTVIAQPDRFRRVGLFLVAVGVACASTGVADVAAQSADGASRAETAAGAGSPPATALTSGPPVGHEHWSFELLDALDIAGVSDAWMVTMRPVGREVVRRELDRTTNVDGAPGQGWERWLDRFDAEMPTRFGGAGPMAELAASGGTRSGDAFLEPGGGAYASLNGAVNVAGVASVWGQFDSGSGESFDGLTEGGVTLPFVGPFDVVIGRQRIRAGGPGRDNVVLGGAVPLDAAHLVSTRATPLPGLDWLLGPIGWQFALAPWGGVREGMGDQGWLGLLSAVAEPHPRLRLGAARVARFGGQQTEAITAGRAARTFFALQNKPTNFDDQMMELSARVRWGLGGLPLSTYVVLAQDDSPIWKQPGLRLGTAASMIGDAGVLLARYEYSAVGRRAQWCPGCAYQTGKVSEDAEDLLIWYRHVAHGLYEQNQIPAGSTLGGYGAEHRLSLSAFPSNARIRGKAWGFVQIREEGNLLYERWPDERVGAGAELSWMARPGLETTVTGVVAGGPAIATEAGLWFRLRLTFPSLARN